MSRFKRFDTYAQTTRQLAALDQIRLDGGTQPREAIDEALVAEYAERMVCDDRGFVVDPEGVDWHKLVVFEDDDGELWLADGFHRTHAAKMAGVEKFQADFRDGSQRDAIEHSFGVNANHGKRRTNADKRRVVERALADQLWVTWADARLARLCKVSRTFVTRVRQELEDSGDLEFQEVVYRADGQPQHRETRASAASSSSEGARVVTSSPPKSPGTPNTRRPRADRSRQIERIGFDDLEPITAADCVIAYPITSDEWDALALAGEQTDEGVTLLCCLPQDNALLFEGPSRLSESLDGRTARIVYNRDHDRFFAHFSSAKHLKPAARSTTAELLSGARQIVIVGDALESW